MTGRFTGGNGNAFIFKYACTNIMVVTSKAIRLTGYVARMEERKKFTHPVG